MGERERPTEGRGLVPVNDSEHPSPGVPSHSLASLSCSGGLSTRVRADPWSGAGGCGLGQWRADFFPPEIGPQLSLYSSCKFFLAFSSFCDSENVSIGDRPGPGYSESLLKISCRRSTSTCAHSLLKIMINCWGFGRKLPALRRPELDCRHRLAGHGRPGPLPPLRSSESERVARAYESESAGRALLGLVTAVPADQGRHSHSLSHSVSDSESESLELDPTRRPAREDPKASTSHRRYHVRPDNPVSGACQAEYRNAMTVTVLR